jgi:hypothetical protein
MTAVDPQANNHEGPYPRAWRFDEGGAEIAGSYVRIDRAHTSSGACSVLVLDVDGEERGIFLFHEALRSRLAQELQRRGASDFERGEPIVVEQLGWRESAAGRRYRSYRVEFRAAPLPSAADLLSAPVASFEERPAVERGTTAAATDEDEIPF